MIKVYFNGIELLPDAILRLEQEYKIFDNNFYLGATPCRSITLEIDKEYMLVMPSEVKLTEDGEEYCTLHVDSYELVDGEIYRLELSDAMTLLNTEYDASTLIEQGETTLGDIVNDICQKYGITLETADFYGSDKVITWYDNTRTARTYIGYVAEINGGYAIINKKGNLEFKKFSNENPKEVLIEECGDFLLGEKHHISRVVYDTGTQKWEQGTENATSIKTGSKIEMLDSSDNEVVNYKQYGYTKQNVYSGKQLLDTDILSYSFEANTNSYVGGETVTRIGFGKVILNANTKYYISYDVVETGTTNVRNTAMLVPVDGSAYSYQYIGTYNTTTGRKVWEFTPMETKEYVVNYWCNTSDEKVTIANMMVSTDSDISYEPYVGGKESPNPDYPQEIEVGRGKNLFNKDLYTYDYVTQNNTGNMTENAYKDIPIYVGKANTTYFISTNFLNGYTPYGKSSLYVLIANYAYGNSKWVAIGHTGAQVTDTSYYNKSIISDANGYLYLRVYNSLTKAVYEELMKNVEAQIEEGTTKTKYLPFNTIETKVTGRNLYPNSDAISNKTISAWQGVYFNLKELISNNNLKIGDKVTCSIFFKTNFIPTKALSFSAYRFTSASANHNIIIPIEEIIVGEWKRLSFEFQINEFTLTAERGRFEANYYVSDDPYYFGNNRENAIWFEKPQFEVGSLTDYQAFEENSIQYHLGENFVAKEDFIENDILSKNITKIILDGSESWAINHTSTNHISFYLASAPYRDIIIGKSNLFGDIKTWIGEVGSKAIEAMWNHNKGTSFGIKILKSRLTSEDVVGFKTWLSENPVTVYYELTTPEQIQLETTGELRTFEPNTIITNDLDSEMEIEYQTLTKGDTIYIDEENVYVTSVADITNAFNNIKRFEFYSLKSDDCPDVGVNTGESLKFIDETNEYITIGQNKRSYNGSWIGGYELNIDAVEKQETDIKGTEENIKNIKSRLNRDEAQLEIVAQETKKNTDELGNVYTKQQVNEMIVNAETGVTNTFSEAGGNNEFRNTGLWFKNTSEDSETNPYEFWVGIAKEGNNDKATNYRSILLGKGSFIQDDVKVPNGNYSISFYYRKLISNAIASVVINGKEYTLDSLETKQFYTGEQDSETGEYIVDPIQVTNNNIKIEFKCDAVDGVEVYDLMCNKGSVKLAYSQNQNETTTSTVNISKGITITSSTEENTKFKADYDGIRILDKNNNPKTKFTDKGTETDELVVRKKATITGLLQQEVDDQTWVTKI